jgi:hypothetical protein
MSPLIGLALSLALSQTEPVPATMLIWGGGKTKADADASMEQYKAASKDWGFFKFEPGWPKILESAKVPGLKPGFFIVALGACFPPEAEPLLAALKVLEPAIYSKPVTIETPLPCPQGAMAWSWGVPARFKSKDLELLAVAFAYGDENITIAARVTQKSGSKLTLLLEDCAGGSFSATRTGLTLDTACVTGRCTSNGHSSSTIDLGVKDGVPVSSRKDGKVIDKPYCD